jgi:tetratricopeptide (TPR) repeat protein
MPNKIQNSLWLFAIATLCGVIYYPGLHGDFLLDDYANLPALSAISAEDTLNQIIAYILNGISGPGGRPISLLSFALQWESWPHSPFSFKLVNLLIHLTNGMLIYLLTRQLLTLGNISSRSLHWLSLVITTLWLLHPLQISTVLYTVQRMTELSALFTLGGLLLYLHGRLRLTSSSLQHRYFTMTAGLGLGLLLGILSKENAILLCLYIMVLEATLLRNITRPKYWKYWASIFLVLPLIATSLYLLPAIIEYAFKDYPNRTFSSVERLFMQSHVLVDYLRNIILPRPNNFGLLRSDFNAEVFSAGTFLKSTLLLSLLFFAWRFRSRQPLISMGILWFFAGHALESTALNLELYFEHRNYLSILGIIIVLTETARRLMLILQKRTANFARKALLLSSGGWVIIIMLVSINEIHLWSDPVLQATIWAQNSPHSHRALGHLAHTYTLQGKLEEAKESYKKSAAVLPHDINMLLNWQELQCVKAEIEIPPRTTLLERMATGNYAHAVFTALDEIVSLKSRGRCLGLDNDLVESILLNLQGNPNYQNARLQRNIHILLADYYYYMKLYEQATRHLKDATLIRNSPDILILNADLQLLSGTKEGYVIAVAKLDEYCATHKTQCLLYQEKIALHIKQATLLINQQ